MKKIFAANWKMHMLRSEAVGFCVEFKTKLKDSLPEGAKIIFAAPATCLEHVYEEFIGIEQIEAAAQNCHWSAQGAHTGELSPEMLQDCGATWSIIGHSERRTLYGETKDSSAKRAAYALRTGMNIIFCVGETSEEHDAGETEDVVEAQLRVGLSSLEPELQQRIHIAYEPVWAIGTGKAATPEYAEKVHVFIKKIMVDLYPGTETPVLYGGSTNEENVAELMRQPNINGVLVGGASLNPTKFAKLIQNGSA